VVNSTATETTVGWAFYVRDAVTNVDLEWGAHFFYFGARTINGLTDVTHFISWEKIYGSFVRANARAFQFGLANTVLKPDWNGVNCLESVYMQTNDLLPSTVNATCSAQALLAQALAAAGISGSGSGVVPPAPCKSCDDSGFSSKQFYGGVLGTAAAGLVLIIIVACVCRSRSHSGDTDKATDYNTVQSH